VAELQDSKVGSKIHIRETATSEIELFHNLSNMKPEIRNRKSYWTLAFSLLVLPFLARAERAYRKFPRLPVIEPVELPSLSIIVPARNEAQNLRRLLPSLLEQKYPGEMEIIVVDDNSTDETAEVVERTMRSAQGGEETINNQRSSIDNQRGRLRLIRVTDLPPGWLGKPHASHIGAAAACGKWLLFTDADMEHEPGSAASAVSFAEANALDGLSLFPQQKTRGIIDGAVLMVAFAGLFAALRPSTTMLNGQYVLVRRDVYEASGGFSAVCSEMLEDLAFGKLLAEQGYRTPMLRGESLASVHMYENWRQMWHGVNRVGSGSLRYSGLMAFIPAIFITGVMMPLWTLLFNPQYIREIPRLPLIWLTAVLGFIPWARRFNGRNGKVSKWQSSKTMLRAGLAPAAAFFVQVSTLWGLVSRLLGRGVSWKGRKV
jgi:chlorobactene glucosyltransferase